MPARTNATKTTRRWALLIGLLALPVLVCGGLLWAGWNSTDRLHKVQAAVVNLDEAVTINGQVTPLGRQLSAALVDTARDDNFTWVLADADTASEGLSSGQFAATVVIPKEFSAQATSFSANSASAQRATVQISVSPVSGLSDAAVGKIVATAAAQSLNSTLTEGYLDQIYLGFNQTATQFQQVADAAAQLADGSTQLSTGTGQLSDGLGQLSAGGSQLTTGAAGLQTGTSQLASGLTTMASQTQALPAGGAQLASGSAALASGLDQLSTGVTQYTGGVSQYVTGVNTLLDSAGALGELPKLAQGISQSSQGATALSKGLQAYQAGLEHFPAPETVDCAENPATADFTVQQCAVLNATVAAAVQKTAAGAAQGLGSATDQESLIGGAAALSAGLGQISGGLSQLPSTGTEDLTAQLDQLRAAGDQLSTSGAQLASGASSSATGAHQLATGTSQLSAGLPALVEGIDKVSDGATQLNDGVDQFATGLTTYVDGVDQSHTGAVQLAAGATQLASGATQLSDGLKEGASAIPTYSDADRQALSTAVASPIETDNLTTVVRPNVGWVTMLLVGALWLAGLAFYTVRPPIQPRLAMSSRSTARLVLESLLPGVVMGVAQAVLLTGVAMATLHLTIAETARLGGILVVAAVTFSVIHHALTAWLGNLGRLVSVLVAVVVGASAFTGALPAALSSLAARMPTAAPLDAARATLTGAGDTASLVFTTVGWLLVALAASWVAVLRARTVRADALVAAAG